MKRYRNSIYYLLVIGIFFLLIYLIAHFGKNGAFGGRVVSQHLQLDHWKVIIGSFRANMAHPLIILFAQIIVIILVTRVFGWICKMFRQPVVICGTRHNDASAIRRAVIPGTKIAIPLSGPNAFGAAFLAREQENISLAEAVATGKVKGIISIEADIPEVLLEGMAFVAAADWLPTDVVKVADIVLPTTAWVEMDGTFVNNEGRAQRFRKAMTAGYPIKGLPARYHASADKPAPFHPPRVHRKEPPGGDLRPAWRVIAEVIERLGGEKVEEPLGGRWEILRGLDPEGEGVRIL